MVVAHEPAAVPEISENVSVEPSENSKKRKSNFGQKVVVVLKDIKAQTFAFWCLAVSRIIVTAIFKIYDSRSLVSLMSIFGQEESVVRNNIIYQFVTAIGTLFVLAFIQPFIRKLQYFPIVAHLATMAAMVMFATSHDKVVMTVLSVCQGLSVGLYISTSVSI